ncbi:Solute carrier family 23 member 2 [Takifugu flavidus]|uniref:Solute carrier family 23 member 2 n=1 Tax=Takifugu flavidus TaxID=433684 RepID=A0A5C6NSM3_9TELE|nr:Solute carrier family 23 member 2 [Takifugu flavidus]
MAGWVKGEEKGEDRGEEKEEEGKEEKEERRGEERRGESDLKSSDGVSLPYLDRELMSEEGREPEGKEQKSHDISSASEDRNQLTYLVTDAPPWYLCIFLAIQHCLTAFGATISIPLILSEGLCLQHDSLTQSHLINSIFFVSGLCTLLQVTFGVR